MGRKRLYSKEDVLLAIKRWLLEHNKPPTIEELRQSLEVGSKRTVLRYLRELEEDGDIRRWKGARGMQLLRAPGEGPMTVEVPIVGEVPAGPFMLAEQNIEGYVRLPVSLAGANRGEFFLLRVRGDSMNQARVKGHAIENGDLVLARQQPDAESGEIVIALVDGEATVKRLVKGPNCVLLKPESDNPEHGPILLEDEVAIQGVVRSVVKRGAELL